MKNLTLVLGVVAFLFFCHSRWSDGESRERHSRLVEKTKQVKNQLAVNKVSKKSATDASGKNGFSETSEENTEVEDWMETGDLTALQRYIKQGRNIERADEYGRTLLVQAAYYGKPELVKTLIDAGADVEATDFEGKTVLHHLVAHAKLQTIDYLLRQASININAADSLGQSPVHIAIQQGNTQLFDLLLENGAKISEPNHAGNYYMSPFHAAIVEGQTEMVQRMIKSNPELIFETDAQGHSSLLLATLEGNDDIVALLRHFGAVSEL